MGKRLVHTPEGVRDIYGKEYVNKQNIQKLFGDKLHSYGYQDIQTRTFGFLVASAVRSGRHLPKSCTNFLTRKGIRWY